MKKGVFLFIFTFVAIGVSYSQFEYYGVLRNQGDIDFELTNLFPFNGKIYFSGNFKTVDTNDSQIPYSDKELGYFDPSYNSYGKLSNINTTEGTKGGSYPLNYFEYNGYLYFTACSEVDFQNRELYRTDGDTVILFKDIASGSLSGFPQNINPDFVIMNNKLYFFATSTGDLSQATLWQTDGTPENTIQVSNLQFVGSRDPASPNFIVYNNELYFTGNSGGGLELFKYNDFTHTTTLVKEINPGVNGGDPTDFTIYNNELFFTAYYYNWGKRTIWKTDGTTIGTTPVIDTNYYSNSPYSLTVLNDKLIYVAFNPNTNVVDLFKCEYDATTSNYVISLLKHFTRGSNYASLYLPQEFILYNGSLYFSASENTDFGNGDFKQLYKTDGTTLGTVKAMTINEAQLGTQKYSSSMHHFFIFNGKLCFYMGDDSSNDEQIWISDGTNNYLEKLTNVSAGLPIRPEYSVKQAILDNNLFFRAGVAYPYNFKGLWRIKYTDISTSESFVKPNKASIYPNPTSTTLYIDIENSSNFETEIYDMLGKKVGNYKNKKTIDISTLSSGLLLVKISDLNTKSSTLQKIIKR